MIKRKRGLGRKKARKKAKKDKTQDVIVSQDDNA